MFDLFMKGVGGIAPLVHNNVLAVTILSAVFTNVFFLLYSKWNLFLNLNNYILKSIIDLFAKTASIFFGVVFLVCMAYYTSQLDFSRIPKNVADLLINIFVIISFLLISFFALMFLIDFIAYKLNEKGLLDRFSKKNKNRF